MSPNYNQFIKKKRKAKLAAIPKLFERLPLAITVTIGISERTGGKCRFLLQHFSSKVMSLGNSLFSMSFLYLQTRPLLCRSSI